MFKIIALLGFCVAACYGDTAAKPVYCGVTPSNILTCLKSPHIVSPETIAKCSEQTSDCDTMTCAFRGNKWLDGNKIDKVKLTAFFNKLAKDKPEWKTVVEYVVPNCVQRDLPPQGVHLNCPAYDVAQCVFAGFIQKSEGSQWADSAECVYPRQYAGACAVCPGDCFATVVPYGSCNACYRVAPAA